MDRPVPEWTQWWVPECLSTEYKGLPRSARAIRSPGVSTLGRGYSVYTHQMAASKIGTPLALELC